MNASLPVFEREYSVPERPWTAQKGDTEIDLYYRTHPSAFYLERFRVSRQRGHDHTRRLNIGAPNHVMATILLYNFMHSLDATPAFTLKEVSAYLGVSSKSLGMVIDEAVLYNPKKIRNIGGGTTEYQVFFNHVKEVIYGIEWQMCAWFPNFLIDGPKRVEEELEFFRNANAEEIRDSIQFYVDSKKSGQPVWTAFSFKPEQRLKHIMLPKREKAWWAS